MINDYQNIVTIVGRPNVGKSTLFNRLVGKRIAIEAPIAGTTRDQLFGEVSWRDRQFTLVDVAGIEPINSKDELDKVTQESVNEAIAESDLILFIVDWTDKNNDRDKRIAQILRRSGKKVFTVVNKADNINRLSSADEFVRLGFPLLPVSGISGKNTGDLLDLIVENLDFKPVKDKPVNEETLNLAIIGRPNVGKSTLLNSIIGEKRAVVSAVPGTTRDIVNIQFQLKNKTINISDTAGIRRTGKIGWDTIEKFSVIRTYKALKDADIAILVIDAKEGLVANDAHILGTAKEWGKGIVLAVNKIDLWEGDQREKMAQIIASLQVKLNFAPWLPIVFISAKESDNIEPLLKQVVKAEENRETIIDDADLAQILNFAKESNPPLQDTVELVQKKSKPPIFRLTVKGKRELHPSLIRYLENKIRDVYPLEGTPIFIDVSYKSQKVRKK